MPTNGPAPPRSLLSRRQLLRRGAATSLALGASSASGCLDRLSSFGRTDLGDLDVPPADAPAYDRWLPAPSALVDDLDLDPSHLIHATPGEARRLGLGALFTFPERVLSTMLDWFGHGYDHYDRALMVDEVVVLEGSIDRSAVESTLADTGYEPTGTYEGYDLYDRADMPRAVGVGTDALVFASDEQPEQYVTALIDAGDGRIDRYGETDDDFARLLEASGTRPANWFTPDDGDFVQAISATYDDESVYHVYHRLYADESSVSESDLRADFEETGKDLGRQATAVGTDGPFATVVQQFDPGTYPLVDDGHEWPQITWGIDHDEDRETVTLHHEAGESVDAEDLSVEYGPDDPAAAQFADEYDAVEPGDDLAVDLSDRPNANEVWMIYRPGDHSSARLLNYRLD